MSKVSARAWRERQRATSKRSTRRRAPDADGPVDPSDHFGLVGTIVSRYDSPELTARGLTREDLFQHGVIGLLRAVRDFDASRAKFSTYAAFWIRHAIGRAVQDQSRVVRAPVHLQQAARKLARAGAAIEARTGRQATDAELVAATQLSTAQVRSAREAPPATTCSLDRPVGGEDGRSFVDFLVDDATPADELLDTRRTDIGALLAVLSPRERFVLVARLGLDGEPRLGRDIAAKLGCTRQNVSAIEGQALRKLRAALREGVTPRETPGAQRPREVRPGAGELARGV